MDIRHLEYFIAIVDANYNLSKAAQTIHISQSALSQMIKIFEENEKILLFERSYSKLKHLTPAGEKLYEHAKIITKNYETMMEEIRNFKTELVGEIRIGVPPFIISTVFSQVISELKRHNPNITITIVEIGAYHLKEKLRLEEVDIAIMLHPTELKSDQVEEVLLIENELCAFMDAKNPLADAANIPWTALNNAPLAIFDKSYMIHQQLMSEFKKRQLTPNILIQSNYWDFILRSTFKTDIITILPAVTLDYFPAHNISCVTFDEPIKWQVVMCRNKKKTYSKLAEFVFETIIEHFT